MTYLPTAVTFFEARDFKSGRISGNVGQLSTKYVKISPKVKFEVVFLTWKPKRLKSAPPP